MTKEEMELVARLYAAERPHWSDREIAMKQVIFAIRQLREAFEEVTHLDPIDR